MAALSDDRITRRKDGRVIPMKVKAATRIYGGGIVASDGGYAIPGKIGAAANDLIAMGVAESGVDNTGGSDGDATVFVLAGYSFELDNAAGGDAIVQADVGKECWMEDDQTVSLPDAPGNRSKAGKINEVTPNSVWVTVG